MHPLFVPSQHLPELYRQFPDEKNTIDEFMEMSDCALTCVKLIVASKLLPLSWQPYFWRCVPAKYTVHCRATAKELLQARTSNNRLIAILCGLWVDTGARPDQASFMMTAACFRGLPLEGGCYPSGGAEVMPRCLIPVIEKHGGRVLVRARVSSIDVERRERKMVRGSPAPPVLSAVGVTVNGTQIKAPMVISGAGYINTVTRLLSKDDTEVAGMPRELPDGVKQSAGFVMVNVCIKGNAVDLGIDNANVWYEEVCVV
jgi:phytoene dehydrogenase-like protein